MSLPVFGILKVMPVKKPVKQVKAAPKPKLVGKVSHYFDKIKVAAFVLEAPLKNGDTLVFEGGDTLFSQKVSGLQIEHDKVEKGKKGDEVGMKVRQKVREGYRIYKKE